MVIVIIIGGFSKEELILNDYDDVKTYVSINESSVLVEKIVPLLGNEDFVFVFIDGLKPGVRIKESEKEKITHLKENYKNVFFTDRTYKYQEKLNIKSNNDEEKYIIDCTGEFDNPYFLTFYLDEKFNSNNHYCTGYKNKIIDFEDLNEVSVVNPFEDNDFEIEKDYYLFNLLRVYCENAILFLSLNFDCEEGEELYGKITLEKDFNDGWRFNMESFEMRLLIKYFNLYSPYIDREDNNTEEFCISNEYRRVITEYLLKVCYNFYCKRFDVTNKEEKRFSIPFYKKRVLNYFVSKCIM